ncbi:MAG: radical SAM family heme chaperone HemW [Clostridia bacterium]
MSKGLYIHIPFCVRKCPYCDFYSVADSGMKRTYTNAVIAEIEGLKNESFDTVFIGGGTPTSIGEELVRICGAVPDVGEFTVEANPGTVDYNLLKELKAAGVNRISFGVQSFNDNELKALGRIHTAMQAEEAFESARRAGFGNISVDLMLSTPYQTAESVKRSLEKIKELRPDHVSAYSLIIEEGTPFYDMELALPDEDEEREIYYLTRDFLEGIGLYQYEISNFARRGFECRHNIKYWTLEPYIGVGAAAHSYSGGFRYCNAADVSAYISGEGRKIQCEPITAEERQKEKFWLGLRMTEGVDYNGEFPEKVEKLIKNGLLEHKNDKIRLTRRGMDLANLVFMEFV